jgi:ribosomal protein S12 methylthiotransferase accessory factor
MANDLKVTFPGGLKVDVEYKGFVIKTDQPVHEGGENTAPSPFDYFLVSIAACAGFYAVAFCRERNIPTAGLAVTMTAERGESKMVERVAITVDLPAGFPDKYRTAILRAIDHCTVKAHLERPPKFDLVARPPVPGRA